MSGIYGFSREAVRVKVKKCEPNAPPEWRKFSVDPQITSLEVLYSILAKAFDLKSDFGISYKTLDPSGIETYLGVLSDWDLDAAFLRAHNFSIQTSSEACLNLRIDIKPFSETTDWEINSPATKEVSPLQQSLGAGQKYVQTMQNKLPGLIMNQMEKTFSLVQRALNLTDDQSPAHPPRLPLSDAEFRNFLDSVGQILQPNELRNVIFAGGIDPSLRRVVWKHILNVYPNGMTGRERMDYMKRKATEYYKLRDCWRTAVQRGPVIGELAYVTSMVRKDVLRTDRLHSFYAGSDDNQNIASLFNILTTYALNHPSVSYCQGMSDIASPLLVTMGDEAHAYICFCAIMSRLKSNFMLDGIAMTQKFTHLAEALQYYDPEFYEYLKAQQADDLLFCYRWLLLEMKREFAFEDSLRMLEVLWSSLRSDPPLKELFLYEKEFEPPPPDIPAPKSPSIKIRTPRENAYTKVCALRRQSSSLSLLSNSPNQTTFALPNKLDATKRMNQSLDENISRIPETKRKRCVIKAHQSLDETKMLLMMENLSMTETKFETSDIKEECNMQQITFHPTNPFIDEANLDNVTFYQDSGELTEFLDSEQSDKFDCGKSSDVPPSLSPKKDNKSNIIKQQKCVLKNSNKNIFSYNAGNSISKQLTSKKGGHFKDLKEKIAAGKKGILASLDKIDNQNETSLTTTSTIPGQQCFDESIKKTKGQKVVKNFNEFLNFASINKSRISDKLVTSNKMHSTSIDNKETKEYVKQPRPLIKLTKNSFDDSDSSTLETSVVICSNQPAPQPPSQGTKPLQLQLTNIVAQSQQSLDGSSPDDSQDYYPMTTSMTRELRLELENLDRQVFGDNGLLDRNKLSSDGEIVYEKLGKDSLDLVEVQEGEIVSCPDVNDLIILRNNEKLKNTDPLKRISTCSTNTDIFVWENPLHQISGTSSCNFNEVAAQSNDDENGIGSYTTNGTVIKVDDNCGDDVGGGITAMTPDEQQDLEYDGDIIIECLGNDPRKSVTPLRLIQQKSSSSKLRDESDSDNTDSWNTNDKTSINPFLPSRTSAQELIENTFKDEQQPLILQPDQVANNPQLGEEAAEANLVTSFSSKNSNNTLPPPTEFGGGNPFLMFLCLTLLLQHRNFVMKNAMDYNEMAMHFDKMVRKHDVTRVLNQARRMYSDYLKSQMLLKATNTDGPTKS